MYKKIVRIFVALLFSGAPLAISAEGASWKPIVQFKLEDTSFRETMTWISGWSYSLTEYQKYAREKGFKTPLCLDIGEDVESRVILDALNREYKDRNITADQASPVVLRAIITEYGC